MSDRQTGRLTPDEASRLFEAYHVRLAAFARGLVGSPELAAEVVQSAFGKAIESAGSVGSESIQAWLYRVTHNEAMAVKRREGVEARALLKWLAGRGQESEAPGETLVRAEQVERVRQVLTQLPPEQQQVVRLRIYEEHTFAEIAGQLSLPLGTVLTRMRLALAKLHKALHSSD